MKESKKLNATPSSVRFSEEIEQQITLASKRLGLAKQDVIRLACAVGLEDLRRANYDLAGAIVDRAKPAQDHCGAEPLREGDPYKTKRSA